MMHGPNNMIGSIDFIRQSLTDRIVSFKTESSAKMWFKEKKSALFDQHMPVRMGILTLSFYILTNSLQRFAGVLSIHGGQPFLAKGAFGIVSTTACCLLSREIQELILPVRTYTPSMKLSQGEKGTQNLLRRASLSVGVFSLLEKKSFLTALPSSVLSIGVHAVRNGKVLSTNPVANERQRKMIQILGKRLGCHQCGRKQLFDVNKGFIADHMPPTKFAKQMNELWWRKALKLNVSLYLFSLFLVAYF